MGRGLRLALLAALLSGLGSQLLLHITAPQRISSNITGDLDQVSYVITIEGTPYTLHLKQQLFLSDDFRVYTYTKGGAVHSDFPHIKDDCYYQGYIAGFPNSLVTLSTCSGLRGLLQFENASYGIEPLDSSPGFEHIIYQIKNENTQSPLFANNYTDIGREKVTGKVSYKLHTDIESMSDVTKSPRYLEIDVILDKGLYNYLGSDKDLITEKIVQLLGFVNSMFTPLNMTIVLSSLEFWTDNNKIRTTGEADEILQRFLQWKESYLVLRPHDVAYLFVYRDHPSYVGATFAGRICLRNYAGGVALYQRAVTLETFSVIIAQLLGLSLGITYDDSKDCQCPGYTCIMHTKAVLSNGVKAFSSCSIRDFKSFIKHRGGDCLSNRPYLNTSYKRASVCGNRIVERGEQCDCGSAQECAKDKCCTNKCRLKPRAKCGTGLCCQNCKFKAKNKKCRPTADSQCDLNEYCNGSSAFCPPDLYVQNGHRCEHNTAYCYKGRCQSPDIECQRIYGKGSKNAPLACYEEINSQTDRFGHCGNDPKKGFRTCSWMDVTCGKLVCTYPSRIPFTKEKAAIIYAQVREHVCISLDYMKPPTENDPLLVKEGTKCGPGKVCINRTCQFYAVLGYDCNPQVKCNGHGVCNNKKHCHCNPGWNPPDCTTKGSPVGGSIDSGLRFLDSDMILERASQNTLKNWLLLSFCLFLPVLVGFIIMIVKWNDLSRFCSKEEDSQADESEDLSLSDNRRFSTNISANHGSMVNAIISKWKSEPGVLCYYNRREVIYPSPEATSFFTQ
ncbi:disintegrin and metalloproteinase domain-containing protein 18-like [Trachemys scripta elegans]|uniref:disintegrin and metalloproteinase domain-containing protein 18-like n=1 Tax=Trachemys scripta elegans TaxID=31138 RepID=UPI001551E24C|nr:disintegrin and metalloproteinase domain-containing protein 18-like [Trachemys scripta elegans]